MNFCIKREFCGVNKENSKPRIPRPPNAFMLYANENRKRMSQLYPTESNKDISKRLGNGWKALEEEERKKYFDKARVIGLQHKKEFPDYVYNPKEARLRKAMREATRDRSIGTSPMLQRPNARRVAHNSWISQHDELMMSPLGNMRAAMEAPVCGFPPLSSSGNNQFMGPMNGYTKMETGPMSSANYMQSNPLAQLQQHTEMWTDYQQHQQQQQQQPPQPPRTPASHFMMGDMPQYHQSPATPEMQSRSVRTPSSCNNDNTSAADPEKIHDVADFEQQNKAIDGSQSRIDASQEHFMPVFERADVDKYEKIDDTANNKMAKKSRPQKNVDVLHLPLSCHNFCASHKLFSNDLTYQTNYIVEHFQNLPSMTLLTVTTPNGTSFPYASYTPTTMLDSIKNEVEAFDHVAEPSFFHTDVGFIPMSERLLK